MVAFAPGGGQKGYLDGDCIGAVTLGYHDRSLLHHDRSHAAIATVPPGAAMEHGPMVTRMLIQTTLWFAAMGAILFLAAGDWRWPQG
jgi:hypothetical protein